MARAVVFAYHDVGVRCLSVLLAAGVEVALVVTHRDNPEENIWFGSVERLAREHGLEVATPGTPDDELLSRVEALAPDFLFSFYYRHMLPPAFLAAARRGAFNVHGSLLPRYRGRVPVNWAILRGERETGATLHEMVGKPDAGRIVDQMAVPILPDDMALEVFRKVTVAAEVVLHRSLPRLLDELAIAAQEAGKAILEVVRRGFEVEAKHDASPVAHARSGAPPFWISYCQWDYFDLPKQARDFTATLKKNFVSVQLFYIPSESHISEVLSLVQEHSQLVDMILGVVR